MGADGDVYLRFDMRAAYASLPSGHSTAAFSILVALAALFPAWRPYLAVYAIFIALSRIVVLAHHPTDVLAGAVVGTLGALLAQLPPLTAACAATYLHGLAGELATPHDRGLFASELASKLPSALATCR